MDHDFDDPDALCNCGHIYGEHSYVGGLRRCEHCDCSDYEDEEGEDDADS